MNLGHYVGLEYGDPYDCFTLVKAVRDQLGLKTPTYENVDVSQSVYELGRHMLMPGWRRRSSLYTGQVGDILLMSQAIHLPAHHCGVFISDSEVLHIEWKRCVSAIAISQLFQHYPGSHGRWWYAG